MKLQKVIKEDKEEVLIVSKPYEKPIDKPEKSLVSDFKKTTKVTKESKPSFMERNPDLEKFIGENLLSKIGIVIFVIGMGFLVKLGIDNEVITEVMRVVIGVLIGGAMIGLAHYLRSSFSQFSSILIGGALSVLYLTIGIAFHQYELISQTLAFVIMVLITSFGVLLSIYYDRKVLAILALLGGFGTPFFVSTGSGNYVNLLSYIIILDIGMLALVYFKKWNIINYLTYTFTYILYYAVFQSKYLDEKTASTSVLFIFLTAFYILFFLMSIVNNIKNKDKFKLAEVSMLLSNSAIYFGFGLALSQGYKDGIYNGLFTGLIAVFNFIFAFSLYKRKNIDTNILYLLVGMVLTFVTLIAPIQLEGNYITLFWALESVLLLWLSRKSGIHIVKLISFMVTILMSISLIIDWKQNYTSINSEIIFRAFINKAFITSFVSMISVFVIIKLFNKTEGFDIKGVKITVKPLFFKILFTLIVYIGLYLEINDQLLLLETENSLRLISLGVFNYSFVLAMMVVQRLKPNDLLDKTIKVLSLIVVISYITTYLNHISTARDLFLYDEGYTFTGFYIHYILLVLLVVILVNLYRKTISEYGLKSKVGVVFLWCLSFIFVFISSAEAGHIYVIINKKLDMPNYYIYTDAVKYIYPVVWTVTSLILMSIGMKFRIKTLRLASLALFAITIAKLFVYDFKGNSTAKIISFILLGVILLLVSFLYQKLKFILKDDENKK